MTLDLGLNGNVFGGRIMEWLDEAAAIFVYKELKGRIVTLKVSEVLFKVPVHERDILEIYGDIKEIGTTSITVDLDAITADDGVKVCSCEIKMVHVNEFGEKEAIPEDVKARIQAEFQLCD
jgi:acyl-CoA thioesterase YciA